MRRRAEPFTLVKVQPQPPLQMGTWPDGTIAITTQARQRSRRITSDPIGPLLVKLTIPMLFGIVSMMLLGIVDTWFISLLGTLELAAIGFIIPVYMILMNLALGLGMGISSISSRLMGEDRHEDAAHYISNAMVLVMVFSLAVATLLYFLVDAVFVAMGADASVMPFIRSYMYALLPGVPLLMITMTSGNTFRAIGAMKTSAFISATLSLLNLLLDPILIFGFGPIPALGMQGAALASVIAASCTVVIALYILSKRERLLRLTTPDLAEVKQHWHELLKIALPAMGANSMTPVAAAIMTAMMAQYGPEAVAGFGVGARIESLALLVVFALSATLPMFIGQNIGAGRHDRAYIALSSSLKFTVAVQLVIYVVLLASSSPVSAAFSEDEAVAVVIQRYLYILPVSYCAHGVVTLVTVSLNVLYRPTLALITSMIRLLLLYLPLAWLGAQLWQYDGLFLGAALGNFIAAYIAWSILRAVCDEQKIGPAML